MLASETIEIGGWRADRSRSRIWRGAETRALEPKVMDLLFVLASRPNDVFSREALMGALWPDAVVGEDALSRCVFKLRKAIGDSSRSGGLIETIPKRGYRLVVADEHPEREVPTPARRRNLGRAAIGLGLAAAAATLGLVALGPASSVRAMTDMTIARAGDSYYQFTRADNDAAIVLYERALALDPDRPEALAGLAGALVQKRMRWPDGRDAPRPVGSALKTALASGRLADPAAAPDLGRAVDLAGRAAGAKPRDPDIQRAFGLALSARGRLDEAAKIYDRALGDHPDHWGLLLNRADLHDIAGRQEAVLPLLERAYDSMSRAYPREPAKVRPWQAALGAEIGRRYEARSDVANARRWYRRTTRDDPSASLASQRLEGLERRQPGGALDGPK